MPDIEVFDAHFHYGASFGASDPTKFKRDWLDTHEVSGILCCTDLACGHEEFERVNGPLLEMSTQLGRDVLPLLAMVHLNAPQWQEHAKRWFDRYPTLVGIKIHPPVSKYRLSAELLDPLFDFAMERKLCLASHTTPIPGLSSADFHDSLCRRPETTLILYHASPHEQAAYLAEAFANVYVEPSWLGFFPSLFQLTRKLGGWRKLLGGTDGPGWFGAVQGSPYDDLVAVARKHFDGNAEAVADFCGQNVKRLLATLRPK